MPASTGQHPDTMTTKEAVGVNAHQIVEAVLFASDAPLTADEIARADETLDEDRVEQALQYAPRRVRRRASASFQMVEVAEGYQILTRPEFAPYLERFDNVPRPVAPVRPGAGDAGHHRLPPAHRAHRDRVRPRRRARPA